jgi:two-component sensor histidine kinase
MMAQGRPSEAEKLRAQIAVLSEFGKHALKTQDLQELLQRATEIIAQALDIELVKVLELLPDGSEVLVRAGVGWNPGVVGHATFGANQLSPAGFAMQTDKPVISYLSNEERFDIPELLREHGVLSMVNVVIRGDFGPWGVLEVDSREVQDFDEDDISFLQNYANQLASAVERLNAHQKLTRSLEERDMLMHELQHRVRNMLGNISVLAKRTVQSSDNFGDFLASFDERLRALARSQDMLLKRPNEYIKLREVLSQELEAHGFGVGQSVSAVGPDISLPPAVSQALAMAFHELTTNAIKYGALKEGSGKLDVVWRIEAPGGEKDLLIRWRETGVRINHPSSREGYGSEVIRSIIPYMIAGTSQLEFHSDGVECNIRLPAPSIRDR